MTASPPRVADVTPTAPTVIGPADAARLVPELGATSHPRMWVYRYQHPTAGWRLSIATHAEPGSNNLSLGGFRIAPEARTSSPGFDSDVEAIGCESKTGVQSRPALVVFHTPPLTAPK